MAKRLLPVSFYMRQILVAFASILFMLCVSPILLPVLAIFFIISTISNILVQIKYTNQVSIPTALDVFCGIEKKMSSPIVHALIQVKGRTNIQDVRKHLIHAFQLDLFPIRDRRLRRFQQLYVRKFGYNYFIDDNGFSADRHILNVTEDDINSIKSDNIDQFNENKYDWRQSIHKLMTFCGNIPLDPGRPLWQIFFYQEENYYNILLRYNHCVIDGINVMRLIFEDVSSNGKKEKLPYQFNKPNFIMSILLSIWSYLIIPVGFMQMTTNPGMNPLHGAELSGEKRFLLSRSIPSEDIKEITKVRKTSFNKIMLSCATYATRFHYINKQSTLNKTFVFIPLNTQNGTEEVRTLNDFAASRVSLSTESKQTECDTALKRLLIAEKDFAQAEADMSILPIQLIIKITCGLIPPCIHERFLDSKGTTFIFSNIPGPSNRLNVIDDNLSTNVAFWVQTTDPLGMGLGISCHLDETIVSIVVDKALMKTKEEGIEYLEIFLEEIYNLRSELGLKTNKFF